MYKKALNGFFLKVHPDFFHNNREQQAVNENSVAQLNELLSWAKEFKSGKLRSPPATTISLTFYRRLDEDEGPSGGGDGGGVLDPATGGTSSSFAHRGFASEQQQQQDPSAAATSTGGSAFADADRVQSTFELPEGFTASEASRGLVERSVNKFLRDLLRRSNCMDSVTESISAAEDATAARMEVKPLRQRRQRPRRKGSGSDDSSATTRKPKSLLDEAVDSIDTQWTLTPAPRLEELIEADQVLFSRELSPLQSAAAMNTLRSHLGELRYETWESMPVIISDHFGVGEDITGSITVPWDFAPPQFVSFLAHNAAAIHRSRAAAMDLATTIEQLIGELCAALTLDDVLVSCSHKEAQHTLRLLHRNRELLAGVGLTHLTLELQQGRFATRANGVVIVSASMRTQAELREWLEALQPKLALQKRLYTVSKHMLETTMWHLTQFRDMVEPAGLDGFQNNDCTYGQRLEWAKELFRVGPSLAQWDWSDFTFMLSNDGELDIDWSHGKMTLPHDFDGDALVRYVEDIQRDSVKRKRAELLSQSAAAQAAAEAGREHEHALELQLASEGGGGGGTSGDTSGGGEGGSHAEQRLRDFHRRASPHLEEHLVSSPDRVDPHSTERPLSHAVTFNSDTEAEEQLKWEGFYQEPYVDQVPTGDVDDMAHTYMLTNRWHREAAAERLLVDLKGQYGPKSRKFDYQKMGDVLEINNARVQPKGFPVLTRGIKPGGH